MAREKKKTATNILYMNWNRRGLVRDANFFIIVNLIWIFLSFYTSISAIHDIVQAYHASADRQTLIHHACIACEWAGASAWLFGAVLFWIQIIKMTLYGKNEVKTEFSTSNEIERKKKQTEINFTHISLKWWFCTVDRKLWDAPTAQFEYESQWMYLCK